MMLNNPIQPKNVMLYVFHMFSNRTRLYLNLLFVPYSKKT